MKKKSAILLCFLMISSFLQAQIPAGYYDRAVGKSGHELLDSLCSIISGHKAVHWSCSTYDQQTHITTYYDTCLAKMFRLTDPADGVEGGLFDIYGGCVFDWEQTGAHSSNFGEFYEKEHAFCASWFNGREEGLQSDGQYYAYRDLHHLHPAEGTINNAKNNNPYGIVARVPWNRIYDFGSAVGNNVYEQPDASVQVPRVTVFEPADAYKGDFARNIFYISARYLHQDDDWAMTSFNEKSQLAPWAYHLLLEWHFADPVSAEEVHRNNVVYSIQGNRNPFIDHPELVTMIWDSDSAHFLFSNNIENIPYLIENEIVENNLIELRFSEPMSEQSLQTIANYNIWPMEEAFAVEVVSSTVVHLQLEEPLREGKTYKCSLRNLRGADQGAFLRDTIVNLQYGVAREGKVIAGWTFSAADQLGRVAYADAACAVEAGAIYFDGTHGSDNFSIAANDSLHLPTGTVEGNWCTRDATRALQFKKASAFVSNGNSFVISCSTINYENISLSFASRYTSTGFKKLTYAWSNGGEFTTFATDSLPDTDAASSFCVHSLDLSEITALNNQDSIMIRVTLEAATGTGNTQFDNIFIQGEKCIVDEVIVLNDTVLRGETYSENGFSLSTYQTQSPGMNYFYRQQDNGPDCDSLMVLKLYIVPTSPLKIPELQASPKYLLYPNPACGDVTVVGPMMKTVVVRNGLGQEVGKYVVDSDQLTLPVSSFPAGFYVVSIFTKDNSFVHKKLIVRR